MLVKAALPPHFTSQGTSRCRFSSESTVCHSTSLHTLRLYTLGNEKADKAAKLDFGYEDKIELCYSEKEIKSLVKDLISTIKNGKKYEGIILLCNTTTYNK